MQTALNRAGFGFGGYGLIVTHNASPATEPETAGTTFAMTANEFPSIYCAGNEAAYCGLFDAGYFLASGNDFDHELESPPMTHWPLVFFVGGQATRSHNGEILNVHPIDIPINRRQDLHVIAKT